MKELFVPHETTSMKSGDRFDRLLITGTFIIAGTYRYYATYICDCGKEGYARIDGIKRGTVKSCGCLQKERTTTHGMTKNPIFLSWRNMIDRCNNEKNERYHRYGGRGISVCEKWLDLNVFLEDMLATYKSGLEIDRIDNDGNYCKENCKWSTPKEQSNNRSTTRFFEYNGERLSIRQWSEKSGINYGTLWERLSIHKWDIEKALTTPPLNGMERALNASHKRWGLD